MELPDSEPIKLPTRVMCGDQASITKTESNPREQYDTIENKPKEYPRTYYARISPTPSRLQPERPELYERLERCERTSALSEHAIRATRRRVYSIEAIPGFDGDGRGNRAVVQAALGSFRWPPYLVCVWLLTLVLSRALHSAVTVLQRSLPPLRNLCQYLRAWTEQSWNTKTDLNHRIFTMSLAFITGFLYTMFFSLYLVYCIAIWSIEPLYSEVDEKQNDAETEPKVINYVDELISKNNFGVKQ